MDKYSENILKVDTIICANIEKRDLFADDGLLAQNIMAQLRNFVEAIAIKIYSVDHDIADGVQERTKKALKYIKSQDDFVFLQRFHKCLEVTDSHSAVEPEAAVRLLWLYFDYLLECKKFLKNHFNLDVLSNLYNLPLEKDKNLQEYYEKIADKIEKIPLAHITESPTNRFYVEKKKLFVARGKRYYEITLTEADNKTSKFDRFIAFTKLNIPTFYTIHLRLCDSKIEILNREMSIKVICGFKVSVRPCEFNNFFRIIGHSTNISTRDNEYAALMSYLTETHRNLTELLDLDEEDFYNLRQKICAGIPHKPIFDGLEKCRALVDKSGGNLLRYLLFRLNNRIVKDQFFPEQNPQMSDMYVKNACISFDVMPFSHNPSGHVASYFDLLNCIDFVGHEHELLARIIKTNTETKGKLYTPIGELTKFQNLPELMEKYNSLLYPGHKQNSSLKTENGFVFISGYENNSIYIIRKLLNLSADVVSQYSDTINKQLDLDGYLVDDESKKQVLREMFVSSRVALVYGSAGTGKSTIIKHISHFFRSEKLIYITNTHAAIENLKRIVGTDDALGFYTIKTYLSKDTVGSCDVLFIDECSTVSNEDMASILRKSSFKLIVLVGDIYQIESIKFGNWFYIAKEAVPKESVFELTYVRRTADTELKRMWNCVRVLDDRTADVLELNNMCSSPDESIFAKAEDDEIVLCLNYDGLYGINNINKFLQDNNSGKSIELGQARYKEGDPIVFKETEGELGKYLYNNLKGQILKIDESEHEVEFTIEVNIELNRDIEYNSFCVEESLREGKSVVRFRVGKFVNTDDDDKNDYNVVPFQVAYAVSIHKAQGLEYDSVKIIITDEVEELISHNIFYTAVTRARKKLKIYWTKHAEQHILSKMHFMFNKQDAAILREKLKTSHLS